MTVSVNGLAGGEDVVCAAEWCRGEQSPATPGDSMIQTYLPSLIPSFLPCPAPSCTQGWFLIPFRFSLWSLPHVLSIAPCLLSPFGPKAPAYLQL